MLSLFSSISQQNICPLDKIGKNIDGNIKVQNFDRWSSLAENVFDVTIKRSINIIHKVISNEKSGKTSAILTKNKEFHKQLIGELYRDNK